VVGATATRRWSVPPTTSKLGEASKRGVELGPEGIDEHAPLAAALAEGLGA
jgi:hypothetical protein